MDDEVKIALVNLNIFFAKLFDELLEILVSKLLKDDIENIKFLNNPSNSLIKNLMYSKYCNDYNEDYGNYPYIHLIKYAKKPTEKMLVNAFEKYGLLIKYFTDAPISAQKAAIKQNINSYEYINNKTDEIQIFTVECNPKWLLNLDNPCLMAQFKAVEQLGVLIKYINNPSLEIKMAAVRQNGLALQYIDDQTLEIVLLAVKQNGFAIEFANEEFKNNLEVQLAAVKNNPFAIKHLSKPYDEVQMEAVKANIYIFGYIDNPCLDLLKFKFTAFDFNKYVTLFKTIKNPTKEDLLNFAKQHGESLKHIKNPSKEIIDIAIKACKNNILHVNELPTEEIALLAVEENPRIVLNFENLSENVWLNAIKRDSSLIAHYTKVPSIEMQFKMIDIDPYYVSIIKDIDKNINKDVIVYAIKKKPKIINYFPNLDNDLYELAVSIDGLTIKYVHNQSAKLQKIIAIEQNINAFKLLRNSVEEDVIPFALNIDGMLAKYIDNLSESNQLIAVKNNGLSIQYIENPSETVQLAAIMQNINAFYYIDKPTNMIKKEIIKMNPAKNILKKIDFVTEDMALDVLNNL